MSVEQLFTEQRVRKIWKKIKNSFVPVVSSQQYAEVGQHALKLRKDIRSNAYMPGIGHGYLGVPKSFGCTRFLPIINATDMAVYYLIVDSLQKPLVKNLPSVFGGWWSKPTSVEESKSLSDLSKQEIDDPYSFGTLNPTLWFSEWKSFNDVIYALVKSGEFGNYVVKTDIANFYDTIDIQGLISRLNRESIDQFDNIDVLNIYLSYWDRRVRGYEPSRKGIPQEIFSDASRLLSHYYLHQFDLKFIKYCEDNDLKYVRWSDDILVFGNSPQRLEQAIHIASKYLLNDGLNLNASKTQLFSRSEFSLYRGLDVLDARSKNDVSGFSTALNQFLKYYHDNGGRMDTVFKSALSFNYSKRAN